MSDNDAQEQRPSTSTYIRTQESRGGFADLSAVIVTFNAGDDLCRCIGALQNQGCTVEIVVVDNGSPDGSVEVAKSVYPNIRVVDDGIDDGFAGGANRGAAHSTADLLLFLNPDVFLEPGVAQALVATLREGNGRLICGPRIVEPGHLHSGELGFTVDLLGDPVALSGEAAPLWLSATFATSREVFDRVGGFDAAFFMFCEDMDFCWRTLLHGYEVRTLTEVSAHHLGGASASGGYVRKGKIEVSAFRIALRERNTLSTLVRCGPVLWLVIVVPLRVIRILAIMVCAIAWQRPDLIRELARGLIWNLRRIPELIAQRQAIAAPEGLRWRVLRNRMRRDLNWARVLFRFGWPHFVDRQHESS